MYSSRQSKVQSSSTAEDSVVEAHVPACHTESVQCKFPIESVAQKNSGRYTETSPLSVNKTGMPDQLKSGLESLSGLDLSPVRVHYNSPKPKQLGALAYAQGTNIHLGAGQEKHLPHEGWHVVQQMQGRVKPTMQMKGTSINNNPALEREADEMGRRAYTNPIVHKSPCSSKVNNGFQPVLQRARTKVTKAGAPPWTWTDNLNASWKNNNIPIHPCFQTHVPLNRLYGGWTVIDSDGTCDNSKTYGPYKPGVGKANHVERKFFNAMQDDLENEMSDDDTYNDDALAVVEINQWNTPCSGALGCTTFLNNKINELNTLYNEVSAAGRFRAAVLYESSVSEMYPKHPKLKSGNVEEFSDDEMDLGGGEVLHEKIKPAY